MNLLIDLFSGLGGGSSAFVNDPAWRVLRLDNNEELVQYAPDTVIVDITDTVRVLDIIHAWLNEMSARHGPYRRLVVWASPPCVEFSTAYYAPRSIAQREGRAFSPNMKCVAAVKIILKHLGESVDYWAVENVKGAIRYFEPFFGDFALHHGPYFVWGNFPALSLATVPVKEKSKMLPEKPDAPKWLRANKRAEIPYEFSQAFKEAITNQTNLSMWTS